MASRTEKTFFVVDSNKSGSTRDTEYVEADGSVFGDAPRCEVCGYALGMRSWLAPYEVELTLYGSEWGDFAFFHHQEFLISDRAVAVIEKNHLVGLSGFEPVEAVKVKGRGTPPTYHRVSVGLGELAVDEEKSVVKRSKPITCDRCRMTGIDAIFGFVLEGESRTSGDIFIPRGLPGVVVATERFKQLVEDFGLTNITLIPTDTYEWDPMAPVC